MNEINSALAQLRNRACLIQNKSIRETVSKVIEQIPIVTWQAPASRNHHLLDERGEWGNLIHTVRVVDLFRLIAGIVNLDQKDIDIGTAAAILHDICRHGLLGKSDHSLPNHPYLVEFLLEELNLSCDYYGEIVEAVKSHMGRWSPRPVDFDSESGISVPLLVHLSDVIVARWAEIAGDAAEIVSQEIKD